MEDNPRAMESVFGGLFPCAEDDGAASSPLPSEKGSGGGGDPRRLPQARGEEQKALTAQPISRRSSLRWSSPWQRRMPSSLAIRGGFSNLLGVEDMELDDEDEPGTE